MMSGAVKSLQLEQDGRVPSLNRLQIYSKVFKIVENENKEYQFVNILTCHC